MNKEDLYVGMRVYANTKSSMVTGVPGTIIDTCCSTDYDCLIEFDRHVGGHDGLNWGTVKGKIGYCFWLHAESIEEIRDEVTTEDHGISYYDLINGV